MPTLRSIVKSSGTIRSSVNVREASCLMEKHGRGLLVMDGDDLVGIFTPKDLLYRVVAKEKSPDLTSVYSVMTPNPDCVDPDISILEALNEMHQRKYLHLPVRDHDGTILGLVDVMELVANATSGWKWGDIFENMLDNDKYDELETSSITASSVPEIHHDVPVNIPRPVLPKKVVPIVVDRTVPLAVSAPTVKQTIPKNNSLFSVHPNVDNHDTASVMCKREFLFKLTDHLANVHKIKCSIENFDIFQSAIAKQLNLQPSEITIKYVDEENDEILVSSDTALSTAVDYAVAKNIGMLKIKSYLIADTSKSMSATPKNSVVPPPTESSSGMIPLVVGVVVAVVAVVGFAVLRRK